MGIPDLELVQSTKKSTVFTSEQQVVTAPNKEATQPMQNHFFFTYDTCILYLITRTGMVPDFNLTIGNKQNIYTGYLSFSLEVAGNPDSYTEHTH